MLTEGKTRGNMKHFDNGKAPLHPPSGPPSPRAKELTQQATNKQSTPPEMCEVCKVKEVVYHVCNDCYMAT